MSSAPGGLPDWAEVIAEGQVDETRLRVGLMALSGVLLASLIASNASAQSAEPPGETPAVSQAGGEGWDEAIAIVRDLERARDFFVHVAG